MLGRNTTLVEFLVVLQMDLLANLMVLALVHLTQYNMKLFQEYKRGRCIVNRLAMLAHHSSCVPFLLLTLRVALDPLDPVSLRLTSVLLMLKNLK